MRAQKKGKTKNRMKDDLEGNSQKMRLAFDCDFSRMKKERPPKWLLKTKARFTRLVEFQMRFLFTRFVAIYNVAIESVKLKSFKELLNIKNSCCYCFINTHSQNSLIIDKYTGCCRTDLRYRWNFGNLFKWHWFSSSMGNYADFNITVNIQRATKYSCTFFPSLRFHTF